MIERASLHILVVDDEDAILADELYAFHVANAHTDGDAIVHFRRANVAC